MTAWILVRHGATDWNRDGRYQGQADPPLNAEGRAQAARLADALAARPIEAVYSSDLQRARHTAEVIAGVHGLAVHLDQRLREVNQGAWEGMLVADIAAGYPAEWRALQEDPLNARAPGGESAAEVAERAMASLREIAGRHPLGPVIVVSHGLTLGCVVCSLQGLPLAWARQKVPLNGSAWEQTWP
ncbi:MAG: histidine phosphatase family protein [Chloroflexi bacterium]|nr:histidine phosphatase family protein [Chloroflexota bacterium]